MKEKIHVIFQYGYHEIKRFLNYLSGVKKFYFFLSFILFFIVLILFILNIDSSRLSFWGSLIVGYFGIGKILDFIEEYVDHREKIKWITYHTDNSLNIYEKTPNSPKTIIEKLPDFGAESFTMSEFDAYNLKSGLIAIRRNIENIRLEDLYSFKEKRILYLLKIRIDDSLKYLSGVDIHENEDSVIVRSGPSININDKFLMWVTDIPKLIEGSHGYGDTNLFKINKRRSFIKYE